MHNNNKTEHELGSSNLFHWKHPKDHQTPVLYSELLQFSTNSYQVWFDPCALLPHGCPLDSLCWLLPEYAISNRSLFVQQLDELPWILLSVHGLNFETLKWG